MENENPLPDSSDSPKTLGEEFGFPNSQCSSTYLFDLDDIEAKESQTEEDDEILSSPLVHVELKTNTMDYHWRPRYSEWFVEESQLSSVIVGAGLANLGNSCFLNAVLQCFMHTVPLLDVILSDKLFVDCGCEIEQFCLLCVLRELAELSITSTNSVFIPYKLVDNLRYFSSSFVRYQQEDAHEFLQCFLDRLENCYDARTNYKFSAQCNNNFVKQVFSGRLVSNLKCCSCGHSSDTYEPSIDLSLEIEDAENLLEALQSFTKVEKLEDLETKFTCEGCKEQVSIEKQLAFDQVPSVASFHLKRFKNEGSYVQKIDKHVAFPKELDLLPFAGSRNVNDAELKYNLYAIVVHSGPTSTSGHYYCFIRLSPDIWCIFDDSKVFQVCEDFVLSQEAYILFYAKEGTSLFSSFIETQKSCFVISPKSVLDILPSLVSQDKNSSSSNETSNVSGLTHNELESNKLKDNLHRILDSIAAEDSSLDVVPLQKSPEDASPSLLERIKSSHEVSVSSITHAHLRLDGFNSCKRRSGKYMDELQTMEACLYAVKNCHELRRKKLLAEVRGLQSKGSRNRKKNRKRRSKFSKFKHRPTLRSFLR